jgi:hypothetical protein
MLKLHRKGRHAAEEKKSLTAKDAKKPIFRNSHQNAKTTPGALMDGP